MMRLMLSGVATLLILATGCGGEDGGSGPDPRVLTTLELTPATAGLFTVAPGNTVTLTVVAKDQDGQVMTGVGPASFSTSNAGVATVDGNATVAAVGSGTAEIAASLTVGSETEAASMQVSVAGGGGERVGHGSFAGIHSVDRRCSGGRGGNLECGTRRPYRHVHHAWGAG